MSTMKNRRRPEAGVGPEAEGPPRGGHRPLGRLAARGGPGRRNAATLSINCRSSGANLNKPAVPARLRDKVTLVLGLLSRLPR
jgi:hypothetical protein